MKIQAKSVMRIQIELTTVCTCDCDYCPREVIPKARSLGHMDPDTEALLLDRLEEYPGELVVCVSGFGEPLCYPRCLDFMRELKRRREVHIELNTNASLLTEKVAEQIIGKNIVDEIQISLNLPTKQLYEKFKSLCNYGTVFKNLMNFYRLKGDRDPVTDIRLLDFKQTKDEMKYAARFWAFQIGPRDAIRVESLGNWMGLIDPAPFGVEFKKKDTDTCPDLDFQYLAITKEGRVLPCCYAIALPEGHPFELGHIRDAPLAEFLCSGKRREMLEMQKRGMPMLECGTCCKIMYKKETDVEPMGTWVMTPEMRYFSPRWVYEKIINYES